MTRAYSISPSRPPQSTHLTSPSGPVYVPTSPVITTSVPVRLIKAGLSGGKNAAEMVRDRPRAHTGAVL